MFVSPTGLKKFLFSEQIYKYFPYKYFNNCRILNISYMYRDDIYKSLYFCKKSVLIQGKNLQIIMEGD